MTPYYGASRLLRTSRSPDEMYDRGERRGSRSRTISVVTVTAVGD